MTQTETSLVPGPRYDEWQSDEIDLAWYDVDGTLVPIGDKGLPSQTFINLAREAGKITAQAIMTGRIRSQAMHIIEACEFAGVSIFSNGAERLNGRTGDLKQFGIPIEDVLELTSFLQFSNIPFWVNDHGKNHFWIPTHSTDTMLASEDVWATIHAVDTMRPIEYSPYKPLYILAHDVSLNALHSIQEHAHSHASQDMCLNVLPKLSGNREPAVYDIFLQSPRAFKEVALLETLESTGNVSLNKVLVVDDGPNGINSLKLAGTAVAMGNAVPEVKASATHIAPPIEADGAIAAQRELILNR